MARTFLAVSVALLLGPRVSRADSRTAGRRTGVPARGRELAVRQYCRRVVRSGVLSPIRVNRQNDRSKLPRQPWCE